MKYVLAMSLTLNGLLGAGLLAKVLPWRDLVVHADGRGALVPPANGDVDADGAINLADAIYIMNWLFLGGPQPQPIECPPPKRRALPATGQMECYDRSGNVIDCASDTCAGQDGLYQTGCPLEGRFVDHGDGTVTDTCTGLMWQQNTGNDGQPLTRCEALAYCEDLELGGRDDWRLPNVRELQSIVDYGRAQPSIDLAFNSWETFYWSSTSYAVRPEQDLSWVVSFDVGFVANAFPGLEVRVRAVRGGR